jgi:hypothetical protein
MRKTRPLTVEEVADIIQGMTREDRERLIELLQKRDLCLKCGSDRCAGWCDYDSHY